MLGEVILRALFVLLGALVLLERRVRFEDFAARITLPTSFNGDAELGVLKHDLFLLE